MIKEPYGLMGLVLCRDQMLHIKAPVREPCSRENSCQHVACLLPAQTLNPSDRTGIPVPPQHLPGLRWAASASAALRLSAGTAGEGRNSSPHLAVNSVFAEVAY